MDAWTVFGAVKLFLEIIEGGPGAAVKGILMSGIPYSEVLDVGEVVFGLFDLGGNYNGAIVMTDEQYIPLSNIKLLDKDQLSTALAQRDFPALARKKFATMNMRQFPKF